MFKESKTKPKYSIRKYSIGAASALIGFMALANGQAAQADEAQSISDLTDASNQAQTPQTASTAQLATSEPASVETVTSVTACQPLINWFSLSKCLNQSDLSSKTTSNSS